MNVCNSRAFAFTHTFQNSNPSEVISELQEFGLTGLNLALNYHASRDFLLRKGPRLEYLQDGFNYYLPNYSNYPQDSLRPAPSDSYGSSEALRSIVRAASQLNFELSAWGVFLHNGKLGAAFKECCVENSLGNRFLSELCPSNPRVRDYCRGLATDLMSQGVNSLAIESLHFHGARHGEHHERFFLEMSKITEFLFSLCFCVSCLMRFASANGDGAALKSKVTMELDSFLKENDKWLDLELTKDNLAAICGPEILAFLQVREETVTSLYSDVSSIARSYGVQTRFVDQTPLLDITSLEPLDQSWVLGVDPMEVRRYVDVYEPLVYRTEPDAVEHVTSHYLHRVSGEIVPILRPTFPDNSSQADLVTKVRKLRDMGIKEIDFYLLDTMRPRDLAWIKSALA